MPTQNRIGSNRRAVNVPDEAWKAIRCEAANAGMSASEFVRDAALARAVASYQARGSDGNPALETILGTPNPRVPGTRKPVNATAAYERLMEAAKDGLEVHELVPKERTDLMAIFRMAEARGGYTHRRAEQILGEDIS